MRIYSLIAVAFLLSACAGNPPAWWNPSGTYGTAGQTQPTRSGSSKINQEDETPAEQDIEPALDGYEEMSLTPLEQQVQQAAAQTLTDTSEQVQTPVTAEKEPLPEDGSLPEPSVLK